MILIVGLGNPGMKYKNTYHNLGFMAIDALAKKLGVRFTSEMCDARIAKGKTFTLAKPQTFMNASGVAVAALVKKLSIDPTSELIVCYDDVDLHFGKLRMRKEGSAGTHNGMRDIVAKLGTRQFGRLRIGSCTPELEEGRIALIDFVLSKVEFDLRPELEKTIDAASDALKELAEGKDFARVQERVNRD